ncbi:hypothetical protein EG68_09740 [Paragonimus skrjabini miyazakii]|uniref:Uncharacterized protein n=1 Tax=Paragonimus skrjabini miyazakii TaxID=59628 RepID=A0A8S9YEQ0_9TREM|nr:hypothetical protein EG68_09740 [Paragonimus skrjabini miyazakii]
MPALSSELSHHSTRIMRLLVLLCLVVALFIVYTEARPDSHEQLRETGKNLYEAIRKAVMKIGQKCKAKIDAYLERDGLGDKISEVIQILLKRLTDRIEKYVEN